MLSLTINSSSDTDQRIDKFIKKYLPEAPLGGIYKWLRTGKIKVNRKKVDQTYRIDEGDMIDIYLSDEEIQWFQKSNNLPKNSTGDLINKKVSFQKISILYEDEWMLILNKQPGINVHPGDHKTLEVSLIEQVQDYLGTTHNTLSWKPSLVHRIDRDTSGVIMIAKEKKILESLLFLLQNGKIEKIYHALVVGTPEKPRDTIRAKLLRKEDVQDESKVVISDLGQEAITHYRTINTNIRNKYSLLECRIETGRMHQIRVHMTSIGTPIIGDKAYGNKWENSFAKREYGVTRQLLHAYSLSFEHPKTHEKIQIIAPYQDDMKNLIDY